MKVSDILRKLADNIDGHGDAGQTIDVKAYSELGIQTVGPRMSFVYTPILM